MGNSTRALAGMLLAWAAMAAPSAHAETLYAASVRTHANARSSAAAGTLYTIDPATAAATVVAPLRLDGVAPIGVTGLAVHPRTHVFYGITGRFSPAAPYALVSIDPDNGNATLIGPLGAVSSDIGFSPEGTLYAWLPELNRLATIDLATGKATPKGPSGIEEAAHSGALAVISNEQGYVAATGATGTLDALDLRTGARTRGPAIQGAPFPNGITNLSYSPRGKLLAVNADSGAPANAILVAIDPKTGAVTPIGSLPTDIEGLIFAERPEKFSLEKSWAWLSGALAAATIAALLAAMVMMGRRPG